MEKIMATISNIDPSNLVVYALYFLVVLIILLVFYSLFTSIEEEHKKKKELEFDLERASAALDKLEGTNPTITVPEEYEALEEENAIISYDELVEKTISIPAILETRVKEEEEYERNVPISIEEVQKNKDLQEVVSYNPNDRVINEKEYLRDLKKFRANLK